MKLKYLATTVALTAFAQAQVYSDVVGFVKLGSQTGDSVAANTDVTISIPFVNPAEGIYTVSSWTFDTTVDNLGGTVTLNETLTAGAFDAPTSGAPYMIEVSSGTDEGIFLEVASNTASTLTLTGYGTEFLSGLAADDTITVRQAWTLGTFFPTDLPDSTIVYTYDSDGINSSSAAQYTIVSGVWYNATTGDPATNLVLYPGESFILRSPTATAIPELYATGVTTTTNSRVTLRKNSTEQQDTRCGYHSPVSETLGECGLSDVATTGDVIYVFDNSQPGINKSSSAQYVFSSGSWYNATTGDLANDITLDGGQGFVYRRTDSGSTDTFVSDSQNYRPNL